MIQGPLDADSEEKHEPVSDIDTVVVEFRKRLTLNGRLEKRHSASGRFMSSRPNWHLLQTGGFSGRPRVISNRHVIDAS